MQLIIMQCFKVALTHVHTHTQHKPLGAHTVEHQAQLICRPINC